MRTYSFLFGLSLAVAIVSSVPALRAGAQAAPPALTQADSAKGAIEIAAAEYIIKQVGNNQGITLDPAYANQTAAPGAPTATRRSSARTEMIAAAVKGKASSSSAAHGIHIILSNPATRKDTASITVTGVYSVASTPPMRGFQTYVLALVRDNGIWVVKKAIPLGK